MEGFLIIDKPAGPTSHDVVYHIRRACQTRRVGHAGTLDPLATGVLLVCVGRATRLIEYMVGHDKVYEAVVRLGETTNTYDQEGEIIDQQPVADFSQSEIDQALDGFRGAIQQIPPMFSAIKKDGQPLYKLARAGKTVDRPARPVTIHALTITTWAKPDLHLRVHCSTGTYIRSLAHDIGQALGCGGHLAALRRTAVGNFGLEAATPLADVTADHVSDYLRPTETGIPEFPALAPGEAAVAALLNGQVVAADVIAPPTIAQARLFGDDGRFCGIVRYEEGWWRPEKMFH